MKQWQYNLLTAGADYTVIAAQKDLIVKNAYPICMCSMSSPKKGILIIHYSKGTYDIESFDKMKTTLINAGWLLLNDHSEGVVDIYEEFKIQPNRYIEFQRPTEKKI